MAMVDVGAAAEAVARDEDRADGKAVEEIESLCMRCKGNGVTRIMFSRVPHFRELLLMAFECPHCGELNNEVQFAGQLAPRSCRIMLTVPPGDAASLNRQVVKSDSASIKVPEIELEIPQEAQRGTLSTVEGVLMRAAEDLEALQPERRKADPVVAAAIDEFLAKLRDCGTGRRGFTFVVDDPAGNSFVESLHAPAQDPRLETVYYDRTPEQQTALGYVALPAGQESDGSGGGTAPVADGDVRGYVPAGTSREPHGSVGAYAAQRAIAQGNSADVAAALFKYSAPEEVMIFPASCGACAAACETRMYVTNIPYFKEVIVMATSCVLCGFRNSEVKPGGSIPLKGKTITVRVVTKEDLSRDVIKSDTASVRIPELDLDLEPGTLGGMVTTVEGLVSKIVETLQGLTSFRLGDSAAPGEKQRWDKFFEALKKLRDADSPWTLVLDDALANSFIAPSSDVEGLEDDTQLTVQEYERTWEQNEELGLNDIDTSSADAAYDTQPSACRDS